MNDIFNSGIKSVLIAASNLYEAGENELARKICVNCVKDVAKQGKTDVLTFFYGSRIYDKLKKPEDAAKYIYIAGCAKEAYSAIESLGAAEGGNKPWAIADNGESDKALIDAFKWLRTDREIQDDDSKHLSTFVKSAKNRNKIHFKMVDKLKKMMLTDIITLLVNKNRMITEDGELR